MLEQVVSHWRNGTLARAILGRTLRTVGLRIPATELRTTTNVHLRRLCSGITGTVLSIGEGNGDDKESGLYRDYFKSCSQYTRMEYDKGWGGVEDAEIYADARSMPQVETESFDCVFCVWVFEHIDDIDAAVAEIWRILKPGGSLIFCVPLNYRFHGTMDYWRYSEDGTRQLLRRFTLSDLYEGGPHRPIKLDPRLKFYGPAVQTGPLGYVGVAVKPHT